MFSVEKRIGKAYAQALRITRLVVQLRRSHLSWSWWEQLDYQRVKPCRSPPSWSEGSSGTAFRSYHRSAAAPTLVVKQTRPPVLNTGTTHFDERGLCPAEFSHTRVIDQLRLWLGRIRLRHMYGRGWAGNGIITALFFWRVFRKSLTCLPAGLPKH